MAEGIGPVKVNNWHQALSDLMFKCPEMRAYEVAEFFGVTEAWLSTVKNSDAFVQFHNQRREKHFSRVSAGVGEKLTALAEISLDEITERVEEERDSMTLSSLHDIGKLALGALGFGSRGPAVNVNVSNNDNRSVIVNDAEAVRRGRNLLKQVREQNDESILETRIATTEVVNVGGH